MGGKRIEFLGRMSRLTAAGLASTAIISGIVDPLSFSQARAQGVPSIAAVLFLGPNDIVSNLQCNPDGTVANVDVTPTVGFAFSTSINTPVAECQNVAANNGNDNAGDNAAEADDLEAEAERERRVADQIAQILGFASQAVPGAFNPDALGQLGVPPLRREGDFPDLGVAAPVPPNPKVRACLEEIAFLEQQLNNINAEIAALLAERPDENDVTDEDLRGEEGFQDFLALDLQLAAAQSTVSAIQNDLASARRTLSELRNNGGVNVELSAESAAKFAPGNDLLAERGTQNDARKSGNRGDAVVDVALIVTGAAAAKLLGKAISGFKGSARFATESTGRILKGIADKGVERAAAIAKAEARAQRLARDAFRKQTRDAIANIPANVAKASDDALQAADDVIRAADDVPGGSQAFPDLSGLPKATEFGDNVAAAAADPKKEALIRDLIQGQQNAFEAKNRAVQEVLDVFASNQAALNSVRLTDELTNAGVGLLGVSGLLSVLADTLLGGAISLGSVLRAEEIKLVNVLNVLEPELANLRAEANAARNRLVQAALARKRAAHLQQVDALRADRQALVERLARLKIECEDLQANNYADGRHGRTAAQSAIGRMIGEPRPTRSYRASYLLSRYRQARLSNSVTGAYGYASGTNGNLPGLLGDRRFNAWLSPSAILHNDRTANNVEGASFGLSGGISWKFHPRLTAGVTAQYSHGDLTDNPVNLVRSDSMTLGLFTQSPLTGNLTLSTLGAYTHANIFSSRSGISGRSKVNSFTGQISLSSSFKLGAYILSPGMGLTYVHMHQGDFVDSSGVPNGASTVDQLSASLSGGVSRKFDFGDTMTLTPSFGMNAFLASSEISSTALEAVGRGGQSTNTGLSLTGGLDFNNRRSGISLNLSTAVSGITSSSRTLSFSGRLSIPLQ